MGLDPRKLPRPLREKLGIKLMGSGARMPLAPAQPAIVWLRFNGPPPTATHHDKRIQRRGERSMLVNNPALRAAHAYYARQIPQRPVLVPVKGPVIASVEFRFQIPPRPARRCGDPAFPAPHMPHTAKPDRDNAAKVLFDELALAGFIDDDAEVFAGPITKWWAAPGEEGVDVWLRTWLGAIDPRTTMMPPKPGQLYPLQLTAKLMQSWREAGDREVAVYTMAAMPVAGPPTHARGAGKADGGVGSPTRQNRSQAARSRK